MSIACPRLAGADQRSGTTIRHQDRLTPVAPGFRLVGSKLPLLPRPAGWLPQNQVLGLMLSGPVLMDPNTRHTSMVRSSWLVSGAQDPGPSADRLVEVSYTQIQNTLILSYGGILIT